MAMFFDTGPSMEDWLGQQLQQDPRGQIGVPSRPPYVIDSGPMDAPKQKGGTNWLKAILGGALDGVATHYGAEPGYGPSVKARREAMAQLAQAQAKRQADWEDWKAREDYERANKAPDTPAIVDNLHAFQNFTPEERKAFAEYQSLVNPRYMTGKDGLPYQTNAVDAPDTLSPEEVAQLTGGGASNGTGGFR